MRIVLVVLFALVALPALAQGWDRYDNARFGYGIDIPPGFIGDGEAGNGDGQIFQAAGKPSVLMVWGGNMLGDFEAEIAERMAGDARDAWNVTYQAITPRWASWSALKGFRILYQRMILLCNGKSYAAFRAEYSVTDSADMEPVIDRLVQSLRGDC